MPRFVAFLRGVSPLNASMPDLKRAFESAGFKNVRTILSSGNVAFDTPLSSETTIELRAEAAMSQVLGRTFYTIVRSCAYIQGLLATNPYMTHGIPPEAKRVISFLREARPTRVALPLARDHASVFLLHGREVFTAYLPNPKGPIFMNLIEQAFGADITTRTVDTVAKCAAA